MAQSCVPDRHFRHAADEDEAVVLGRAFWDISPPSGAA
jgi:hypothetical protein